MKPFKAITLLLLLAPALATLQAKPKKPYKLPAAFEQARYVYVEAEDGQGLTRDRIQTTATPSPTLTELSTIGIATS